MCGRYCRAGVGSVGQIVVVECGGNTAEGQQGRASVREGGAGNGQMQCAGAGQAASEKWCWPTLASVWLDVGGPGGA